MEENRRKYQEMLWKLHLNKIELNSLELKVINLLDALSNGTNCVKFDYADI